MSHGYRDPRDPRNSYEQHRQESERQEHAETKRSSHINAESLEQRINKVISENKAIVETLDPYAEFTCASRYDEQHEPCFYWMTI